MRKAGAPLVTLIVLLSLGPGCSPLPVNEPPTLGVLPTAELDNLIVAVAPIRDVRVSRTEREPNTHDPEELPGLLEGDLLNLFAESGGFGRVVRLQPATNVDEQASGVTQLEKAVDAGADLLLLIYVTRYRIEFKGTEYFSAMYHLAGGLVLPLAPMFDSIRDELYSCEYQMELGFYSVRSGRLLCRKELSVEAEMYLNDTNRGWSVSPVSIKAAISGPAGPEFPWSDHAEDVIQSCEPYAREELKASLVHYLREDLPRVAKSVDGQKKTLATCALVIGVDRFSRGEVSSQATASRDASEFAAWLEAPQPFGGQLPRRNVRRLLNEEATRTRILAEINDHLLSPAKSGDRLLLYFSGYGAAEQDTQDGSTRLYLAPFDADSERLNETAVALDDVLHSLKSLLDMEVTVILDTAFEGESRSLTALPVSVDDARRQLSFPTKNHTVWLAAAPGTPALELEALEHGLFTSALLLGLGGAADAGGDGWSSVAELAAFVAETVKQRSRLIGSTQQEPLFLGSPSPAASLGLVRPSERKANPGRSAVRLE